MKLIKIKGLYTHLGKIELENAKTINWNDITDEKPVLLPSGSKVELILSVDENNFISGIEGIVWGTYDTRQAEVVQNTLLAQNINCEIKKTVIEDSIMYLILITNDKDVETAINFIWKSSNGLRLKPDWAYPKGEKNKSFELWLSGHS